MSERKKFLFPDDSAVGMAVEARAANALEFIAHYLERIDGHLEKLANAQTAGSLEGIRTQVAAIANAVARK